MRLRLRAALLSFLYASWVGFLHGAALCESEEISIESYLSATLQMLTGLLTPLVTSAAAMAGQRSYASSVSSLNANTVALEHIVQFCDENGVDRAPPSLSGGCSTAGGPRRGHGEKDLAAVCSRSFRKKDSGGETD